MPSRRRRRSKNLGTNLAEVQRRLRYLERRPVRTKLQNRVVTTSAIGINAVTPEEVSFGTTVVTDQPTNTIENPKDGLLVINETAGTTSVFVESNNDYVLLPAVDTQARDDADAAQATADGKNKIFRQNNAPTSAQGPTTGDLWYDQDDDNKMYRYTGSAWTEAVVLGNNALASISASKITAGTIDASVINVSNLNAGNISTGNLAAARIATTALNANNITAGTISGITIKTSGTQRRIEITNEDDMIFYNDSNTKMGTITSVNAGSNTAPGTDDNVFVDDGIMIHGGSDLVNQGTAVFPSIFASSGEVALVGGANAFYANGFQSAVRGSRHNNLADIIELTSGYSDTGGDYWRIEFNGPIIADYAPGSFWLGEMLWFGSGAPSASTNPGKGVGHIVFRYT
jgi:hypothetical protein